MCLGSLVVIAYRIRMLVELDEWPILLWLLLRRRPASMRSCSGVERFVCWSVKGESRGMIVKKGRLNTHDSSNEKFAADEGTCAQFAICEWNVTRASGRRCGLSHHRPPLWVVHMLAQQLSIVRADLTPRSFEEPTPAPFASLVIRKCSMRCTL